MEVVLRTVSGHNKYIGETDLLNAQTLKPLSFMLRIRFWPCIWEYGPHMIEQSSSEPAREGEKGNVSKLFDNG